MDGIVWVDSFTNSKVVVSIWNYWEMRKTSEGAIQKRGLKYKGGIINLPIMGYFYSIPKRNSSTEDPNTNRVKVRKRCTETAMIRKLVNQHSSQFLINTLSVTISACCFIPSKFVTFWPFIRLYFFKMQFTSANFLLLLLLFSAFVKIYTRKKFKNLSFAKISASKIQFFLLMKINRHEN